MTEWKHKLRDSTAALCQSVADLHGNVCTPAAVDAVARLVHAATDIVQLQERVSISLEDALRNELAWRKRADERLEALEDAVRRLNRGDGGSEKTATESSHTQHEQRPAETAIGYAGIFGAAPEDGYRRDPVKRRLRAHSLACPEEKAGEISSTRKAMCHDVLHALKVPEEPPHKRIREDVVGIKTGVARPLQLGKIPTLMDVQRDEAERRKARRQKLNHKPPPCDKCRLRKRAVMLRKSGYVNEKVFERWAAKPGACLDYMHQDELVAADEQRSQLSFDESETQSP